MRIAFVAVGVLVACTGSQASSLSQPPLSAQPQTAPPPQPQSTSVSPQTVSCPPPPPQAESHPPSSLSGSLRGFLPSTFWCTESRKNPGAPPLNVCYSTEKKCTTLRKEAIDAGAVIGECRKSDSAACFSMVQDSEQRVHWRCYASMEECQPLRRRWLKEQPKLRIGQCSNLP